MSTHRARRAALRTLRGVRVLGTKLSLTAGRLEQALATAELVHDEAQQQMRRAMLAHDMLVDPDEAYFRDRYWEWIHAHLRSGAIDLAGKFLDAGCGPGRLTVPLARLIAPHGGVVVAVDNVPELLDAAQRHAAQVRVTNASFVRSELLEFLAAQADAEFGGALCLEVPYVIPELDELIAQLFRVLQPGGLLVVSFRPRYYLSLLGIEQRSWDLVATVLEERAGVLPGMGWQNWHSASDVIESLTRAGFADVALTGLGNASGIEGDPFARIVRPSDLGPKDRERLASAERRLGAGHPDVGRYILAATVRPPA
jgi:2-polyprenyl-3-methyl-5-hydroxy-6-metoxy-1,4-benzoquinol methylase